LPRQSIDSRLAGYGDANDAERLCLDTTTRSVVGGRAKDTQAASASEMARFETAALSATDYLRQLTDLSGQWIGRARRHRQLAKLILDTDSSVTRPSGWRRCRRASGRAQRAVAAAGPLLSRCPAAIACWVVCPEGLALHFAAPAHEQPGRAGVAPVGNPLQANEQLDRPPGQVGPVLDVGLPRPDGRGLQLQAVPHLPSAPFVLRPGL
jgi:hypothetical protein